MPSENSRFDCIEKRMLVPKTGIKIIPLGDVHYNAPMFAKDIFRQWCDTYRNQPDCYFIGLGDYLETMSGSERKALVALHDSSHEWLDEKITADVDALAEKLAFTKGKWLGMLSGNHNHITGDGETVTQMLARRLDAPALGVCAAIRLLFMRHPKCATTTCYDIWAHHGRGGGQLAGSTLNALERWANGLDCDLVLMGHDHKCAPVQIERLGLCGRGDNLRPSTKTITLCRTGGFMKAYEKGKVSYLVERAARPVRLGTAEINITLQRETKRTKLASHDNCKPITRVTI